MYRSLLKRQLSHLEIGCIDFCSNDYLGFAKDPKIQEETLKTMQILSKDSHFQTAFNGSSGSRLISGNHPYIDALESELAEHHKAPAGLIFPNGFFANYTLLSCLPTRKDILWIDEQAHASLWEGAKASLASFSSFRHNCLESLIKKIKNSRFKYKRAFICIQTLYPATGEIAPLKELIELSQKYEIELIVDEAHATGLYGSKGLGVVIKEGLENQISIRMHTFSKALGAYGAIVFCNKETKQKLIENARPYIYSTALPLYNYVLMQKAHEKMRNADKERKILKSLIHYFKEQNALFSLLQKDSMCPIFSFEIEDLYVAKQYRKKCEDKGLMIYVLTPPSTRRGKIILRICLHAFNTKNEIDRLINIFQWIPCKIQRAFL